MITGPSSLEAQVHSTTLPLLLGLYDYDFLLLLGFFLRDLFFNDGVVFCYEVEVDDVENSEGVENE